MRRDILKKLDHIGFNYSLYGPNWEMSKSMEVRKRVHALRGQLRSLQLPSLKETFGALFYRYKGYRGPAKDKFAIIGEHKFSLIIENDIDSLSEKVFDCLSVGTIPLYAGPRLAEFTDLDKISVALPLNADEAVRTLTELDINGLESLQDKIYEYVTKPDFMDFVSPNLVSRSIVRMIIESLK
jgi:hypothetical protein